jgi:hypothetical protein
MYRDSQKTCVSIAGEQHAATFFHRTVCVSVPANMLINHQLRLINISTKPPDTHPYADAAGTGRFALFWLCSVFNQKTVRFHSLFRPGCRDAASNACVIAPSDLV